MKPITDDKYLQFVIQHHKDIEALNEVYEHAKAKLPLCAAREVAHAILELKNGFFKEQGLEVRDEGDLVWWYDPKIYDKEKYTGPYWGFETKTKFKWEWLVSNDQDDAARLILYVDTEGIKKKADKLKYINKWRKALIENKNKFCEHDIFLEESLDYDEPFLSYRPLKEVNIELLAVRDLFHKRVQEAIREFTSALLPILRKGN
jgi:hypothetical protein